MRKAVIASFVLAAAVALVVAATATGARTGSPRRQRSPAARRARLNLLEAGTLTVGADNPAFPPWFGGAEKKPWKVSNPYSGKGYESAVVYAIAAQLGLPKSAVRVEVRAVQQLVQARQEAVRLLRHPGLVHARAREGGRLLARLLLRQPVGRGPQGHADREGEDDRGARRSTSSERRSGRRATRTSPVTSARASRRPSTTRTTRPSRRSRTARSTASSSTCRPRST